MEKHLSYIFTVTLPPSQSCDGLATYLHRLSPNAHWDRLHLPAPLHKIRGFKNEWISTRTVETWT